VIYVIIAVATEETRKLVERRAKAEGQKEEKIESSTGD